MYCPECGNRVNRSQKYCTICGTYLGRKKPVDVSEGRKNEYRDVVPLIFVVLVLFFIFIFITGRSDKTPVTENESIIESFYIENEGDTEYSVAYSNLKTSLNEGDIRKSQKYFEIFFESYKNLKDKAGEEHISIVVPPDRLRLLNKSIRHGNLSEAMEHLSMIGSTCGIKLCHEKGGSVMYEFASEYFFIKRAIENNNTEVALSEYNEFREKFFKMKQIMIEVMPEKTERTMKVEYIDTLKDRLESGDLEKSREALSVITSNMCSLDGCHSIILTAKIQNLKEVE